jgi:galactokinase/mevalonate kinase-like predicted kinase
MISIPYRIDLAGGWLDQPWISNFHPGPVITVSIKPTYNFPDRTGMATSTRKRAIDLWGNKLPSGKFEKMVKMAEVLFCYDNFPGGAFVSGSQDSLGIVLPGINKLNYDGKYWPKSIDSVHTASTISWLEQNCKLLPMPPKNENYDVLKDMSLKKETIKELAIESESCWDAINEQNVVKLGKHISGSFQKQVELFPRMMTPNIQNEIEKYKNRVHGMKVTGSGGFICVITQEPIENEIKIRIRK